MMSEEASDRLSSTEDNDYYHGKEGENGFLKAVTETDVSEEIDNRGKDDTEALEMLRHIGVLQSILTAKAKPQEGVDHSDSILYLSRYAFGAQIMQKKKSAVAQQMDQYSSEIAASEEDDASQLIAVAMSPSSKEKKRQLALALATLAMQPNRRKKLVADGAIKTINDLCQLNDGVVRRACAAACAHLSADPALRAPMVEGGLVLSIGKLTLQGNSSTKLDCAYALCNLTCQEGMEGRVIREGVLHIIEKIPDTTPAALDSCLKICLNLAAVTERYSKIEDITEILLHFHDMHPSDGSLAFVLAAINNLSGIRTNQLRLVEDGALKIILKTIESEDDRLRHLSAECLRNLSTCNRTRQKLLDNGIVQFLMNMSRDELSSVRRAAIQSFFHFAKDLNCREKVVSVGAIGIVVRAAMDESATVETSRVVAKTLLALCQDRSLLMMLIQDGVVRALIALIKTDDEIVRQSCIETLCYLFEDADLLPKLMGEGAVGVLVSVCQTTNDLITGEWCAYTLYHLTTNGFCPSEMISRGILPCFIKLCGHSTAQSKHFAAAAFSVITQNKEVNSSCAIPILVHMLRHEDDHNTKSDCASALYNLADDHSNCDTMLQAGGLLPVVRLTQSDHLDTKIKCAAILSRLSQHEQYYEQFGSGDVLRVLLDLSRLDDNLTRRRVVIALSHLSSNISIRTALMELEETPHCIKNMISMPDEHMRRGCAAIVCNLSSTPGSEMHLIRAGIVPTLLVTALITSDELLTKTIALKALVNLMVDSSSYKAIVKEGFIWGLSSLAVLDDMEVITLCAKALCNLSQDFAREMIDSAATIKTVMMMINRPANTDEELELLKNGCRVLINMLASSRDKDEKFRLQAVESMKTMAESRDDEVSEIFILCLCLASQSEQCRPVMVSSKLLASIDTRSIFKDSRIGFAYLTMYRNIANDPQMRTELVDSSCIGRFMDICKLRNPELDKAVAAALYCISCAEANAVKLTEQKAVELIAVMVDSMLASSDDDSEIMGFIVAILYNLSTCEEAQADLVKQGIVSVAAGLLQKVQEVEVPCRLLCLTICHLACGRVNTCMMTQQGCAKCLVFMASNITSIRKKYFHQEEVARAAAAFRNLVCIVTNQQMLVDAGAITSLVQITTYTQNSNKAQAHQARRNAAAALKSLTFNTNVREKLVECEAIDIILHDLEKEMENERLTINHDLLCDLEAESWQNGSRGSVKDGRAALIPPGELFLDLLTGSNNVHLHVDHRIAPLEKMNVEIELAEPPIQSSVQAKAIMVSLEDLPSFVSKAKPVSEFSQMIGKIEVNVPVVSMDELKNRVDHDDGGGEIHGSPLHRPQSPGVESDGDDGHPVLGVSIPIQRGGSLSSNMDYASSVAGKENSINLKLPTGVRGLGGVLDQSSSVVREAPPPGQRAGALAPIQRHKMKPGKTSNGKKKFDKLVAAIAFAKKASNTGRKAQEERNDAIMEDVSKGWRELSKF